MAVTANDIIAASKIDDEAIALLHFMFNRPILCYHTYNVIYGSRK
jgi:hypothetical protein